MNFETTQTKLFHLQAVARNWLISTVKVESTLFRPLMKVLTGHDEAPYETAIFLLKGKRKKTSWVIREYKTRKAAEEGHKEIVKLFKSDQKLEFTDTFINKKIIIKST